MFTVQIKRQWEFNNKKFPTNGFCPTNKFVKDLYSLFVLKQNVFKFQERKTSGHSLCRFILVYFHASLLSLSSPSFPCCCRLLTRSNDTLLSSINDFVVDFLARDCFSVAGRERRKMDETYLMWLMYWKICTQSLLFVEHFRKTSNLLSCGKLFPVLYIIRVEWK